MTGQFLYHWRLSIPADEAAWATTLVVSTLVVICNVYLKLLENHGRVEQADRIDQMADWVYPLGYIYIPLFKAAIKYIF